MEAISNSKVNFDSKFSSFLLALIVCSKLINGGIAQLYSGALQTGLLTMGFIWFCLCIYYAIIKKRAASLKGIIFITYILIFFFISYFTIGGHAKELLLHFVEYGIAGFLIAGTNFDVEKSTRYSGYLLLLLFFPTLKIIQNSYQLYSNILGMSESYILLPPLFAVLIHFLYFRKKNDWLMYIAYSFTAYLLLTVLFKGIRGAVLCIITLAFFSLVNIDRFKGKIKLWRIVLIILSLIVVVNYDILFSWLATFLSSHGVHIRFIEKTIFLGNALSGDYSNGRSALYTIAIQDFIKSPVWGNGIGYFPSAHNINYPHNIVLQVLAEGGLLLAIPILGLIIHCIFLLLLGKIENRNLMIVIILLASCTIPAAFVSDELWNYQLLWVLFGILIKKSESLIQMEEVI